MSDAQTDMFLELKRGMNNIVGETTDEQFKLKKAIEITGFDFDLEDMVSDSGKPQVDKKTGKPIPREPIKLAFSIEKHVDNSSAQLYLSYCLTLLPPPTFPSKPPAQIDKATVSIRKSGGGQVAFLVYYFEEVFVTSYTLSVKSEYPTETVVFSYKKVKMDYFSQEASGTLAAAQRDVGWDFNANGPW